MDEKVKKTCLERSKKRPMSGQITFQKRPMFKHIFRTYLEY